MKILVLRLCIFAGCLSGCMPTDEESYSQLHSDSGIQGKPYDQIKSDLSDLANQHPSLAQIKSYGQSGAGRDLQVIQIGKQEFQGSGKRPAILISEGIHGDEYTNIADRLPAAFLTDAQSESSAVRRFIDRGGLIYVVPIVNPDGYESRRRENNAGQDLNRDFSIRAAGNNGFTQPETKSISNFVAGEVSQKNLSLAVSMEYHCCIGGLIHPWAYQQTPLGPEALQRHKQVGQMVQNQFGYRSGTVREIVGYGAVGGSDDYYHETYGSRSFSFEGSQGVENRNFDKHVAMWNQVIELVLSETTDNGGGGNDGNNTVEKIYLALDGNNRLAGSTSLPWTDMKVCINQQICEDATGESMPKLHSVEDRNIFATGGALALTAGQENTVTIVVKQPDRTEQKSFKLVPEIPQG